MVFDKLGCYTEAIFSFDKIINASDAIKPNEPAKDGDLDIKFYALYNKGICLAG
jgi:hypothetical protein